MIATSYGFMYQMGLLPLFWNKYGNHVSLTFLSLTKFITNISNILSLNMFIIKIDSMIYLI